MTGRGTGVLQTETFCRLTDRGAGGRGRASVALLAEAPGGLWDLVDSVVFLLGWKMLPTIAHGDREVSSDVVGGLARSGLELPGCGRAMAASVCFYRQALSDTSSHHRTAGEFMCSALSTLCVIPLGEK